MKCTHCGGEVVWRNQHVCKLCHARQMRAYRRTLRGFLDQKYTAMSKRVRGKDRNCLNTSSGLPIVPRRIFLLWAFADPVLPYMFNEYQASGFQFKLCPTIDRINPSRGYVLNNMQFLTQSENAKKHRDSWECYEQNQKAQGVQP